MDAREIRRKAFQAQYLRSKRISQGGGVGFFKQGLNQTWRDTNWG